MDLLGILSLVFVLVLIVSFWVNTFLQKSNSSVNLRAFSVPDIPNLSFRFYKPEDKIHCVEIYEAIEALEQIPSGMVDEFVEYLESEDIEEKIFIIHSGKEIIGTCGLKNLDSGIHLLYGLVKPEYQKKGLGGLMLSLRAEELSGDKNMIGLSPTDYSEPYYKRYGFLTFHHVEEDVYPEDDERLSELEDKKRIMLLSVDQQGALFMRAFLEKSFKNQLIESQV